MPAAHAKLSPSGSSRWLKCPGSVRLTADINRESGSAAQRGTNIHQIGENLLIGKTIEIGQDVVVPGWHDNLDTEFVAEKDMVEEGKNYYDYVMKIANRDIDSELIVEMKVDLTDIAPDTFGHADAVVVENNTLHIVDLKTGAGLVSAKENSQLMIYAYGAFQELELYHDIEKVNLHIVQDNARTGGDKSNDWILTVDELITWIEDEVKPKAIEALKDDSECVPGETQCQWCDAASFCTALHKQAEETIGDIFDDVTEPKQVKDLEQTVKIETAMEFLKNAKLITLLIEAYEGRISRALLGGGQVPGYKLVKGVKHRKWTDEEEAYNKLKGWCQIDEVAPRKLVTPNQAEKILGSMSTQKKNKFNDLWVRPEGELMCVPESDKRPAEKPVTDDFEDLDDEL